MKRIIFCLVSALFLLAFGQTVLAEFVSWQDKGYDFSRIKTIYVAALDTRDAELHDVLKEKILSEEFRAKLTGVQKFSYLFEDATEAADESVDSSSEIKKEMTEAGSDAEVITSVKTETPSKMSKAAAASGADVLLRPILRTYEVVQELVPAYTEWRTHQIDRSWKDRDGKWHKDYQTVSYPVHIPDTYVDHAYISCAFEWYDIQTGKLIAGSEDSRDRRFEDNPLDMYRRIVERFVKNMKKM